MRPSSNGYTRMLEVAKRKGSKSLSARATHTVLSSLATFCSHP